MEAKTFSFEDIVGGLTKMGSMGGSLGGDFPRSPSEQAFQVRSPISSHPGPHVRAGCLLACLGHCLQRTSSRFAGGRRGTVLAREVVATSAHLAS